MAEAGVQINWGANNTSDVVSAMRQNMASGKKSIYWPAPATAAPKPAAFPAPQRGQAAASRTVKLKKLRSLGGVAGLPGLYALAVFAMVSGAVAGIWKANVAFAPEMYNEQGMVPAAEAFASGKNYAVFDLNLNIRRLREEHVARFTETPDVVVIGASHWQEAHAGLIRSERMYNGHIHRDYWEDLLGVIEVYARNKRMPKRMIIAVRDKQFTPLAARKDYLWEPGIPNYRKMADRLGLEKESYWKTYPWQRMKERLSLSMLFDNVTRWYNAGERPFATEEQHFQHLDTLLPDGSILWSADHQALFTPERTRRESLKFAAAQRNNPPLIDPNGVEAFDKLLEFIRKQGTQVVLVHPPFNPTYWEAVQDGTYMAGLERVRQLTKDLAAKHGLKIIGDFDPAKVGCTSDMYIDAEHGNPTCLQKIFDQYEAILPELRRTEPKVKL